jgi:autophagy-related protein 9
MEADDKFRFVAFIAGSFAAVLILATVVNPDVFLHFEITPHRTVVYYLSIFGTVLAVARGMVPDKYQVFDPERLMREVVIYTHYMPVDWKGRLHSQAVSSQSSLNSIANSEISCIANSANSSL